MGPDLLQAAVKLAVEQWRVLRHWGQLVATLPPEKQRRPQAQLEYALNRLNAIADEIGIRLIEYEGQPYSPNLPVSVINADEWAEEDSLVVEQTLEPTVLQDGRVLSMGKVTIAAAGGTTDVSRD